MREFMAITKALSDPNRVRILLALRMTVVVLLALAVFAGAWLSWKTGHSGASVQQADPLTPGTMQPADLLQNSYPVAETNTPDIQALADGLQDDPLQIYNYVHDHIRHVLYFGSKKGAELTLLEKSGNDFDQCALLVALLKASGFNPNYEFGWMLLPYDNPDGSQRDLRVLVVRNIYPCDAGHVLTLFAEVMYTRFPEMANRRL